jgi:hypothetical protein
LHEGKSPIFFREFSVSKIHKEQGKKESVIPSTIPIYQQKNLNTMSKHLSKVATLEERKRSNTFR